MFNNIYQGKKVLVTGHAGFKGAWLSLWLSKLGAQVIGYSLEPPTKPNLSATTTLLRRCVPGAATMPSIWNARSVPTLPGKVFLFLPACQ